ncbi:MAG: alpha/beta hydrolase-fold protein [Cyclobacteriaceae bacterium]|nr:alpha/beta hydrolase-fold protein [Cyclobacteriaceae bacterium]
MKNIFILFLAGITLLASCKKEKEKDNKVSIGSVDNLYSDILGEERKILVYIPPSAETSLYSPQRYPVVYLLDGDSHFHAVTGMLQQLSRSAFCPEMIVVAIPNTDRSRDLTPSHSLIMPNGEEQEFLKTSGGGEHFTSFIEKELTPYIEANYPTAPYRMLIGHSFGGLFAINTLVNHPGLFNAYVAIDPSMWWDNRRLLNKIDSSVRNMNLTHKSLFISVANTMPMNMDTLNVAKDTTTATSHIRSILTLARITQRYPANGLTFGWKYYNDDNHGSVPLISEYDALRFIFGFYRMRDNEPTTETLINHFKKVSDQIGFTMLPPEPMVNGKGYDNLQQNKFEEAYSLFAMNIENYPNSANVFDSMGDYYVAVDNKPKAMESFTKALSLKETKETRDKLDKIKADEK